MINEIARMVRELRSVSEAAYLYGSQVSAPDAGNDVDILFVIQDVNKQEIVRRMQHIQSQSKYLLHPVYVSKQNLQENPMFAVLLKDSVRLW